MKSVLLVGNPNCGKTTLFNALTGENQRIGNWPGVTIEKKTGTFQLDHDQFQVTDLPGVYSLAVNESNASQDEQIAAKAIVEMNTDVIINVIDASNLERHLYLASQIMELGRPMILVLNMIDIAEQRGIHIDVDALSKQLGCPVIAIQAHKKKGLELLYRVLEQPVPPSHSLDMDLPPDLIDLLNQVTKQLRQQGMGSSADYYAHRLLEGDTALLPEKPLSSFILNSTLSPDDCDIILADARYAKIHQIVAGTQSRTNDVSEYITARIDRIVLHRFLAVPVFLAMMYFMFLFAINIGGAFQDLFDISTDTIFVKGTASILHALHIPDWLIAIIANGIGKGINTTLTFVPVIAAMFFFLSLLEASGYMARAAFVVDKIMRLLGLPGKSFVPMIVGFGCNVPAVMAARTLDCERDRLLTIMMSPFMSCSARLAIYAVFVAAFFPYGGQNIVFLLYLIGIIMAVVTGLLLRKSHFKGQSSPLILELPAYHRPSLKRLLRETKFRLRYFIIRAGRLIIPVCMLLGALNAITIDGSMSVNEADSKSLLSVLGQWLTPVFSPMGLQQENWPATVGLLTGMLAKEVVVGSLNSLYAQLGQIGQHTASNFDFWGGIQEALWSVPHNLSALGSAVINPILASAPDGEVSQSIYGMMAKRFDGKAGAFAYLLFILLYIPCVSTMAVIRQEASRKWMWFSIIWSFVLAYAASVIFYQLARLSLHPQQSILWIFAMLALIVILVSAFVFWSKNRSGGMHVISTS